ncbi:MAG: dCTP deaminase [Candidatus Dormibacteria bacterium]
MSTVLTEVQLKKAVADQDFIVGGTESSVEGLKYDFTLGSRMLFGHQSPTDASKLSERERGELVVRPGELVYVLSEERLKLPPNMKAELSPKRRISHLGIMVLGGFCVDPGYEGHLVFGLYNLATMPFPLQVGHKIIAAQFYRLGPAEVPPDLKSPPINDFPDDLVQLMQAYEPATLTGVQQSVQRLESTVEELRRQLQDREDWFKQFQDFLKELGGRVDQLTNDVTTLHVELKAESEARQTIGAEVGQLGKSVAASGPWRSILLLLGVAILAALIVGLFLRA